jgi:hypothetical protein
MSVANDTYKVAESVREDADAGKFNGQPGEPGKDGEQGPKGNDGYTPVRGKDYWTPDDISEIKSYVDEEILNGEW